MFDSSPAQQVLAATSKGLSLKNGNGKSPFRDDFTINPFIWDFSAIHVWLRKGSEKHCILLFCMFTSSPSICPRPLVLIRSPLSLPRLQVCCFCPYNCLLYPHCCVLYPGVSLLYLYMYICIYSYRHVLYNYITHHIYYTDIFYGYIPFCGWFCIIIRWNNHLPCPDTSASASPLSPGIIKSCGVGWNHPKFQNKEPDFSMICPVNIYTYIATHIYQYIYIATYVYIYIYIATYMCIYI